MSRDGSGVYSLPGGTTVTAGTTIQSSWANALTSDIAQTFNTVQPTAYGGTNASTAGGAADNLSPDFVSVASGSTTNIGAATSPNVNITGATTVTAFDSKTAGVKRFVKFAAALTLTHNATSLILPGGANITTAAGDTALFISEGSGNWRCLSYQRASGLATIPGAWEAISKTTISSAASWAATGLSAYRQLRITGFARPATDAVNLFLRSSTDNGSSYDSGASDYSWQNVRGASTTADAASTATDTGIRLGAAIGNDTNEGVRFTIQIDQFNVAGYMWVSAEIFMLGNAGNTQVLTVGGQRLEATARDAIQLIFSSGNIASGFVTLEGVRA